MGQFISSTPKEDNDMAYSVDKFFKTFKMESKIIPEDTIILIQSYLEKGDVQRTVSIINEALRDIESAPLNIAVTGETGSGKSSFINALRGIGHEEEGAARIGVTETTMRRTPYTHPKLPAVTIWDLPGLGSTNFPPQKYLEAMKFGEYDFFIIINSTRFKETDAHLAKVIRKMNKNFYFVRTRVDSDVDSLRRGTPSTFNRGRVLGDIQKDCLTQLRHAGVVDAQVFLVSNLDASDYDFPALETTLLRELPAHKRHVFIQCLPNITEAAIDRKRDSLKQKVWLEALKGGVLATIPFVGVVCDSDVEKLQETLTLYRSYFGLDDSSLEKMAKDLHVSVAQLKENLKSPRLLLVEKDESLGEKLLRYVEIFCSVNGGLLATGLYFRKIFYLQSYFLDTVVSDAKFLLRKKEVLKGTMGSGKA